MAHQMTNLCELSVFHCVEGAFGASSGGTPKMKNGAPRDELKSGGGWAVPYTRKDSQRIIYVLISAGGLDAQIASDFYAAFQQI